MSKAMDDWAKKPFGRVITEEELRRRTHPAWPYNYFDPGLPVDPEKVDEILKGCIDVHIHGAPLGSWLIVSMHMTIPSGSSRNSLRKKDRTIWY